MEQHFIAEYISYLPAGSQPLSADVGIIEGKEFLYLFDVGADETVAEFLNTLPKEKKLILSHFHPDHIGNIGRIAYQEVYAGANTARYLENYFGAPDTEEQRAAEGMQNRKLQVVSAPLVISDGVTLTVFPIPSGHAKGSLALGVNGEYLFLGDATYCTRKQGRVFYNAQLLKEQIDSLKAGKADRLLLSHAEPFVKEKAEVLAELEEVYGRRRKNEPYIEVME